MAAEKGGAGEGGVNAGGDGDVCEEHEFLDEAVGGEEGFGFYVDGVRGFAVGLDTHFWGGEVEGSGLHAFGAQFLG